MKFKIDPTATDLEIRGGDGKDEPPKKHTHQQWAGCMAGLVLGLAVLAAARVGQIWQSFDLLSNFLIQGIAITFAFAISLFLPRYKALIGIALSLVLLALYGMWPALLVGNKAAGPFELKPGETLLRVATFNAYHKNRDWAAVSAEIERLDPDVITLFELEELAPALLNNLQLRYPHHASCPEFPKCTTVLLSKLPYTPILPGKSLSEADYVAGQFGGALNGLTISGVHLSRFPESAKQLAQAKAVSQFMETLGKRRILMGDFNATPDSWVMNTIEKSNGLARLTLMPTWPSMFGLPQLAIDHILVAPGIRVLSPVEPGNNAGSDHYPAAINLAIPSN